ncbi:MAG: type VI secretion system baseplate subunit TssK [Bryobacterales bacterium]|nr:type VI secretion system baseplate subunit TssK [Bryobacterales bacterium]
MRNLSRVVWSEGMHLGPHHFQAQNRYFEDAVQFHTASLQFEPYGFAGCQMDAEALRNGTLALVHARGLFADGLSFHMPELDPLPAPRKLEELFPAVQERVDVLLAVPELRAEGPNCALEGETGLLRYRAEASPLPDENTGRDEKPVPLGRKNIRFLLETEDQTGYVTMPIARVRRDGKGAFAFDDRFIPPLLTVHGSPVLALMLRRLLDLLEEKCKGVARPKDLAHQTVSGFSAEGIANAWFLHCLNASVGPLRHLAAAKRAHPEELFVEMSRLAGALCTFSIESHPAQLPRYEHARLADCFEHLDLHIRQHLELMVPSNTVRFAFEQVALYFWQSRILDERTLNRARWVFGISCPRMGEADLINAVPRLVKICSLQFLPKLVERALPGMTLTHVSVPPPAVQAKIDYQYFTVDRAGPCWDHMVKSREFGVYVPGEVPDPHIELTVILES